MGLDEVVAESFRGDVAVELMLGVDRSGKLKGGYSTLYCQGRV